MALAGVNQHIALAAALIAWGAAAADAPRKADPARRFEIVLVVTDRWRDLYMQFDHPAGKPLNLDSLKVAPRRKQLVAVVLFKNCRPGDQGLCNVELDTIAYDSSGKVYGYRADPQFWNRKPEQGPEQLQLGRRSIDIIVDPGDPAGTWRMMATARDRIANVEAQAEVTFQVEPE